MRQDLVDATLRKKNLSGESLEGREDSSSNNTLIPTFQSIEQHDVLAQVLLEIDKGVELPGVEYQVEGEYRVQGEYQVVGEYREVDLLGDKLQFSLVQPAAAVSSSDFYSLQPPGSCSSSEGSPSSEFYSGASPSSQPGSFVELYSDACSPSTSPDSSFGSSQAAVDIESLVDQCFLEEVIHNV